MRLLIVTQAVDTEDPVLGFFVRWIEEFARATRSLGEVGKHVERIEVICLKLGKFNFPKNVRVHSLGKERGSGNRIMYAWRFLSLAWRLRRDYDAVFVHMNPEYVILGGILWRLLDKRVALWYTHKSVNAKLRLAAFFSNVIFTASKESFRLNSRKVRVMGHGIDVDFFAPDPGTPRGTAVLSAGRLSPTKRHDLVIRAAEHFGNEVRIAGTGPEQQRLEELASRLSLSARVHFLGPQMQKQLREEYRTAGVFVHASETGSLDKVVLEALACGLPVVTTSASLTDMPVTVVAATPDAIAKAVLTIHSVDTQPLVAYVKECHSLQHLIPRITEIIETL